MYLTEENLYRYLSEKVNEFANLSEYDNNYNVLQDCTDYVYISKFSRLIPLTQRKLLNTLAECVHEDIISFEECKPIALKILETLFQEENERV